MKDLKIICKDLDEFKPIRGYLTKYKTVKELREVMLEMLEDEKEDKQEPKAKATVDKESITKSTIKKGETKMKVTPDKTEEKGKTEFGHLSASQSGKIDLILLSAKKALSLNDIAEKIGCTEVRVKSHITHLQKDKEVDFETKDDTYLLK